MICADMAKKWARCCQSTLVISTSSRYASCTKAVACSVWPSRSFRDATQRAIHMRRQLLQRAPVAFGPGAKKERRLRCLLVLHLRNSFSASSRAISSRARPTPMSGKSSRLMRSALAKADSRKARVVEMRFFGGLSVDETAEVLGFP